jgi:hypothetical protein
MKYTILTVSLLLPLSAMSAEQVRGSDEVSRQEYLYTEMSFKCVNQEALSCKKLADACNVKKSEIACLHMVDIVEEYRPGKFARKQ